MGINNRADCRDKEVVLRYSLTYIKKVAETEEKSLVGSKSARHDISLKKWRLTTQLDTKRLWFLTMFLTEEGVFEKYSLDCESADDAHYEFEDEVGFRKSIYQPGDERKYLDEIMFQYVGKYGGFALLEKIKPFVTQTFFFD